VARDTLTHAAALAQLHVLDNQTFAEIRTETLKGILKHLIHRDMQHHALGLTKLTQRYNHVQQCTIEQV